MLILGKQETTYRVAPNSRASSKLLPVTCFPVLTKGLRNTPFVSSCASTPIVMKKGSYFGLRICQLLL